MGRRSPRRMWHVAAALAPLPLIGLGYASIPGNQLAYRMELLFSGNGSVHALSRDAGATEHQPLPRAAAALFRTEGKGPRADQYLVVKTTTYADKQFITASVSGGDIAAKGLDSRSELIRIDKVRSPQCDGHRSGAPRRSGPRRFGARGVDVHRIRLWQSPIGAGHCRWRRQRPRPSPTSPRRPA